MSPVSVLEQWWKWCLKMINPSKGYKIKEIKYYSSNLYHSNIVFWLNWKNVRKRNIHSTLFYFLSTYTIRMVKSNASLNTLRLQIRKKRVWSWRKEILIFIPRRVWQARLIGNCNIGLTCTFFLVSSICFQDRRHFLKKEKLLKKTVWQR